MKERASCTDLPATLNDLIDSLQHNMHSFFLCNLVVQLPGAMIRGSQTCFVKTCELRNCLSSTLVKD